MKTKHELEQMLIQARAQTIIEGSQDAALATATYYNALLSFGIEKDIAVSLTFWYVQQMMQEAKDDPYSG